MTLAIIFATLVFVFLHYILVELLKLDKDNINIDGIQAGKMITILVSSGMFTFALYAQHII